MVDDGLGSENALPWASERDFVEVMFAKSLIEATGCCSFLEARQIPARIEPDGPASPDCGVAILVPADRFVEASELLAAKTQVVDYGEDDVGDEEEDLDSDYENDEDEDDDDDDFDDDDDDDFDDDDDEPDEAVEDSLDL